MSNPQKRKWANNMDIVIESKKQANSNYGNKNIKKEKDCHSNSIEPRGINVLEYAEARILEIHNLKKTLAEADKGSNFGTLQKLPRHMRRRAGNHDVRRLPRRIRHFATSAQENSKKEANNKKESRRQRRKPKKLFEEYKNRQVKYKWLETHIWHAKRFYIKENWGYKIARNTFSKALRSSYRAAKSHCLLQDLSFYESIEITGKQVTILKFFQEVAPLQGDILTFSSNTEYLVLDLYQFDKYPWGCLGSIKFQWTTESDKEGQRSGIVFSHPSIVSQFIQEVERFDSTRNARENNRVQINHNPMEFVILKLTGNHSAQFLCNVLSPCAVKEDNLQFKRGISKASGQAIVNCVVKDPRIFIPKNKQNPTKIQTKTDLDMETEEKHDVTPSIIQHSEIWNQSKRHHTSQSKQSDNDLNKMKETLLYVDKAKQSIPSPDIPVCLLHIPGCDENTFSRGFELILPSNWAMPFWIALIYQGARAGGLQEAARVSFEAGALHFPDDFIDTDVGREINDQIADEKVKHYNRVPPAKRVSYKPLGVQCEHVIPWSTLVSDWRLNFQVLTNIGLIQPQSNLPPSTTETITVDDDLKVLDLQLPLSQSTLTTPELKTTTIKSTMNSSSSQLSSAITPATVLNSSKNNAVITYFVLRDIHVLNQFKNYLSTESTTNNIDQLLSEVMHGHDISRALIPVRVTTLKEGSPKDNAMLCIPSLQDFQDLHASERDEFSEYHGPVEPQHKGPKNQFPFVYKQHSKELLLPNVQLTGRSTRWLMGFLQRGDYSLLKGKGTGVGYVSALALCFHFKMVDRAAAGHRGDLVLFRNTNTLQYRFCKLEIIA